MSDLKNLLEIIIKFGVLPVLIINVYWLNTKLADVEEKMYDCFDDRETILKNRVSKENNRSRSISKTLIVAVLPSNNEEETKTNKDEKDV